MRLALLWLAAGVALPAFGQSAPAFEVASVKPQPWTGNGSVGVSVHGNTLSGEHCTLYDLVEFAWDLREVQLSGGPKWASRVGLRGAELYQVIAKTDVIPVPKMSQFRLMLQTLLPNASDSSSGKIPLEGHSWPEGSSGLQLVDR